MNILAIETSCDETAAAIVKDGTQIQSSVISSSKDFHEQYGGIFPELASRKQLEYILPVIQKALHQANTNYHSIDAIAVTVGPGLIGSLLVGVEAAKTIAYITAKPVIPVNHVLAHMYANFLNLELVSFPAISLVVSGGHTELYLMESIKKIKWLGGTVDDAAGECFDKTARLVGFGNRGGPAIQKSALNYKSQSIRNNLKLPRPMLHDDSLNFSFSGLKTAALREVNKLKSNEQLDNQTINQLSYEIQEAITDVLTAKTFKAAQIYNAKSILLSGGVAANTRLREKFQAVIRQFGDTKIYAPETYLCTDNAAYIASFAYFQGHPVNWREITARPDLSVEIDD